MIYQRFLKLAGVVALVCGVAHVAFAANLPTADWTIGIIPAKSETGLSYCSMKNSYENGQMLVFARDGSGSNSIAVDFKKPSLEVGRQYPVTARAGSLTRNLSGLAATKQVLIIQLGADQPFYAALKRKANMTFAVGDNGYAFALDTAVAEALKKLDECAASLQTGVKFEKASIPHGQEKTETEEPQAAETTVSPAPRVNKKTTRIRSGAEETPGLADMAMKKELERDIEQLKLENRKLMLENQTIQGKLLERETGAAPSSIEAQPLPDASQGTLRRVLSASGLMPHAVLTDEGAYRWVADDIYGSAQELPRAPGKSFSQLADEYIHQTASICKGDFAQKKGKVKKAGNYEVLESELMCLDGKNDAAAAVLFIGEKGKFNVVMQEGSVDQLSSALEKRDSILSAVSAKGG